MSLTEVSRKVAAAARLAVAPPRFVADPARDCFLVSYPRSGNTWLRTAIAYLQTGEDVESIGALDFIVPDIHVRVGQRQVRPMSSYVVKSHDRLSINLDTRDYRRVIYVVRDPRDSLISYHRYMTNVGLYKASLADFVADALGGRIFPGSWQEHVLSWTLPSSLLATKQILLLRYEDICADPEQGFAAISQAIGLPSNPQRLSRAVELTTSELMRKRETAGLPPNIATSKPYFIGGARPAQWQNVLEKESLELIRQVAGPTMARFGYE